MPVATKNLFDITNLPWLSYRLNVALPFAPTFNVNLIEPGVGLGETFTLSELLIFSIFALTDEPEVNAVDGDGTSTLQETEHPFESATVIVYEPIHKLFLVSPT